MTIAVYNTFNIVYQFLIKRCLTLICFAEVYIWFVFEAMCSKNGEMKKEKENVESKNTATINGIVDSMNNSYVG